MDELREALGRFDAWVKTLEGGMHSHILGDLGKIAGAARQHLASAPPPAAVEPPASSEPQQAAEEAKPADDPAEQPQP